MNLTNSTENEILFLGDLLRDRGWYTEGVYWKHPDLGNELFLFRSALEAEIKADEENNPHLQVR